MQWPRKSFKIISAQGMVRASTLDVKGNSHFIHNYFVNHGQETIFGPYVWSFTCNNLTSLRFGPPPLMGCYKNNTVIVCFFWQSL